MIGASWADTAVGPYRGRGGWPANVGADGPVRPFGLAAGWGQAPALRYLLNYGICWIRYLLDKERE